MDKEILLMKNVWVPAEKAFTFKERVDPRTGEEKYILTGLILPFDKISRNNVLYNSESIKEKHKQLIGRPVMYNHKIDGNDMPRGHFTNSMIIDVPDDKHPVAGWYYEADIDPEEKDTIRKLERGDLRHVSIQLVGGKVIERMAESGPYSEAYVQDIIEGSLVPAPGFLDTTAEFAEAFQHECCNNPGKVCKNAFKEVVNKGRNCDKCGAQLNDDDFEKSGSWNYTCHKCGFKYIHGQTDLDKKEEVKSPYTSPRYDGDCMICPWDGVDAKTEEELAEGYIQKLGEETVKELIEKYS